MRAWEETQVRYESSWLELAQLAEEIAGEEPGSGRGQELAARWMEIRDCYLRGDVGVATALRTVAAAANILNRPEVRPYFSGTAWAGWKEQRSRYPLQRLQQSARAQITCTARLRPP